jgi:hypothetical protein
MNISEHLSREAYDRLKPWQPISDVVSDSTVCEPRFLDDKRWYCIDPRAPVYA